MVFVEVIFWKDLGKIGGTFCGWSFNGFWGENDFFQGGF